MKINLERIRKIANKLRGKFEQKKVDKEYLIKLYNEYNQINDAEFFIDKSVNQFPLLNCGLSTICLKNELQTGRLVRGRYGKSNHTFLLVDITADQYGGPLVYVGKLKKPWSIK